MISNSRSSALPYGSLRSLSRLAFVTSQAQSLANFRGPLIRALAQRGVEIFALAPDYDATTRAEVRSLGATPVDYRLARTGLNPLQDFVALVSLIRILRRLRPEVVVAYFIKPVIYGSIAAWLAGVPRRFAMIEGLGFVFTETGSRDTIKRALLRQLVVSLYRFALRKVERVVFLNRDDANEFEERRISSPRKSVVLGGIGVDLTEWLPRGAVPAPQTFVMIARLLREKGVQDFAAAARLIKARNPVVRFVLLGALDENPGGLPRSEVEAWVQQGLIEWPGHVDVKPWLARASVFVLPSYYREGVPRSTQEAMAMGLPVITTNAPGCRETVIDGVNGFLVPVRDPAALARSMSRFIENPQLVQTMGLASRRLAEERFDVHKINARLIEIIDARSCGGGYDRTELKQN